MLDFFLKGGILMWPILLCSVGSLAIIIERSAALRGFRRRKSGRRALDAVRASMAGLSREEREAMLSAAGARALRSLTLRLDLLELSGRISPMLGLLGTVLGLTRTFRAAAASQALTNPSLLAGGIWEALITTVAGLFVAIPSLVAHHLLAQAHAHERFELRLYAEELLSRQASGTGGGGTDNAA